GHPFQVAASTQTRINEGERDHSETAWRLASVPRAFKLEVYFSRTKHEVVLNAVQQSVSEGKPPRIDLGCRQRVGDGEEQPQDFHLPGSRDADRDRVVASERAGVGVTIGCLNPLPVLSISSPAPCSLHRGWLVKQVPAGWAQQIALGQRMEQDDSSLQVIGAGLLP